MIEIAHMLFVYTPFELRVIILGGLIGGIYFIYRDFKKDRGFDKEIKNCKNGKEIEKVIVKFYDR